jgi:hypothetical protein
MSLAMLCHPELDRYFYALRQHFETSRGTLDTLGKFLAFRFNVLDYVKPDENVLSDVIKDLLDSSGSHGQGKAFLIKFLQVFGVVGDLPLGNVRVEREVQTESIDRRRSIDLVVRFSNFLLGIENKPWAEDQPEQVSDYVAELRNSKKEWKLLYFSGNGLDPTSIPNQECTTLKGLGRLGVYSYVPDISNWLDECEQVCQAEKVRWFLRDLRDWVVTHFSPEGVVKTMNSEIERAPLQEYALRDPAGSPT